MRHCAAIPMMDIRFDCILSYGYGSVVKNFPTKYIHEPWTAPESIQNEAHCIIGRDYPLPMVNHAVASRNNLKRLRDVYVKLFEYWFQIISIICWLTFVMAECNNFMITGHETLKRKFKKSKELAGAGAQTIRTPEPAWHLVLKYKFICVDSLDNFTINNR